MKQAEREQTEGRRQGGEDGEEDLIEGARRLIEEIVNHGIKNLMIDI